MAVLVTGGAGFIGTHTCVELLNAGEEIVVFDNFANSKPRAAEAVKEIAGRDFKFYKADMRDEKAVGAIFDENEISVVIHFAGYKAVGESVLNPLMYYGNNVHGTCVLLEAMKKHDCKRLVFSSSATVYGLPETVPLREDSPLSAINPYGNTKLIIENICRDLYTSDDGWSIALLRYFNPIGAHESGKIGEDPNGIPNNLMPIILKVVTGKMPNLSVFGNDYPTKDGTGVRDYLHVCDLAEGHVRALEKVRNDTGVEAYNLGTGAGYSVLEIISAFEKVNGVKVQYVIAPRRAGDSAECYSDPSKARDLLKWETRRDLSEMCRDAYRFAVSKN